MNQSLPGAPPALEGWRHVYSGKVRELYVPQPADGPEGSEGTAERVLVLASDRISAYDHILRTEIPDKGAVLTQLSLWWFEQLAELTGIPSHVLGTTPGQGVPAEVAGRAMVCQRLEMFPVECIIRGYLTGSGLVEYQAAGTVSGIPLDPGYVDGSRLPEAIFTPSAKAEVGEHDENIDFATMAATVGQGRAEELREASLAIYRAAEVVARERGIILADTKLEFGLSASGLLTLGDEVLTPDSSRFWDAEAWAPGQAQPSFDKQYVRDWLVSDEAAWDRAGGQEPPALPEHIVERTRQRYIDAYERLTGEVFQRVNC